MLTRRDALRLAAAAAPFAVSPAEAAAPLDGPVPFVPDARPPTDPPPSHLMQGGLILFAEGEDGERTSGHVTFFAEVAGDDWAVEMRTSDRIMGEPERLPPLLLDARAGATAADLLRGLARYAFAPALPDALEPEPTGSAAPAAD